VLQNPDEFSHRWALYDGKWQSHSDGPGCNWNLGQDMLVNTGKLD
jgi:hypothetical protein